MKTYAYYISMKEQCVNNALHFFNNGASTSANKFMVKFFSNASKEFTKRATTIILTLDGTND